MTCFLCASTQKLLTKAEEEVQTRDFIISDLKAQVTRLQLEKDEVARKLAEGELLTKKEAVEQYAWGRSL